MCVESFQVVSKAFAPSPHMDLAVALTPPQQKLLTGGVVDAPASPQRYSNRQCSSADLTFQASRLQLLKHPLFMPFLLGRG